MTGIADSLLRTAGAYGSLHAVCPSRGCRMTTERKSVGRPVQCCYSSFAQVSISKISAPASGDEAVVSDGDDAQRRRKRRGALDLAVIMSVAIQMIAFSEGFLLAEEPASIPSSPSTS